jgi:PAS domain S-box-containing protein
LPTENELLRAIFDRAPLLICFTDESGRIRKVSREWERVLGWTLEEIMTHDLDPFALAYPDPHHRQMVRGLMAEANGRWLDLETVTKDGRRIDTSWAVVTLRAGTLSIGHDVTARKRHEDESSRLFEENASREALQIASRNLLRDREVERRAIARELHDEIGQLLTGISLGLTNSERLDPAAGAQLIRQAQVRLRGLISQVRNLAVDLRPPMLDELGLVPALRWHFERYTEQTNISVHLDCEVPEDERFLPEVEAASYRIVQEALTNVARHSRASEATVQLRRDDRVLWISIADRGRGFVVSFAKAKSSTGLTGMYERAALLGGTLTIESRPGAGATVAALLPLRIRGGALPAKE